MISDYVCSTVSYTDTHLCGDGGVFHCHSLHEAGAAGVSLAFHPPNPPVSQQPGLMWLHCLNANNQQCYSGTQHSAGAAAGHVGRLVVLDEGLRGEDTGRRLREGALDRRKKKKKRTVASEQRWWRKVQQQEEEVEVSACRTSSEDGQMELRGRRPVPTWFGSSSAPHSQVR